MTTPQRMTKQSQTRDRVFELVEQLGVGNAIPSERQLSTNLGVSRLTVRAALEELVREGYLVRRRGSGTFVSEPKIAQELTLTSFSDDMRRRGMRPASRTLSLETTMAGAYLGRCLHVSPSERIVVAKRLRLADTETMAIETLHVRESLVPGLTPRDLEEGSFYDLLENRYGISIAGGVQTIEPTVTNEEESAAPRRSAARPGVPLRADVAVRRRGHRRVRALDLPRRPLPARDGADEPRPAARRPRLRPARRVRHVSVRPRGRRMSSAPARPESTAPGALLLSEIREQPAALERLLEHDDAFAEAAARAARQPLVRMVGHGSSDNAASYGVYAFGLLPAWTALRDSISLSVYYGAEVDLRGSTVVALSQSGRTPDVLDYLQRARSRGAFTIAVTNDPGSALAAGLRGGAPPGRGRRAGGRRDEDLHESGRRARAARGPCGGARPGGRGRDPADGRPAPRAAPGSGAPPVGDRRLARVRRADVRDRARARVRNGARDLAQALGDVSRRGGAADRHRSHARPRRGARRTVPGLDDRLRRRGAARGARRGRARPRGGCDGDRERRGGRSDRGRGVHGCRCPGRRCRCSRRCSPWRRVSCWRGRSRRRRVSTPTGRWV